MSYEMFDRSRLKILPLSERVSDVNISVNIPVGGAEYDDDNESDYKRLSKKIINAHDKDATITMMYGAHVIRKGCSLYMIELMKRGIVTHFATNGAGAIHDFELAMNGKTCESVAKYISEGQFGLWQETGFLNEAIKKGDAEGLGFGEAAGRYIWENDFPYREQSVLAQCYHEHVPCTVHVGIGNDIIHEHNNFDPAACGRATYRDFLIYAQCIENLQDGVFLNFGSAVTGPEVYLKALAMARNVAKQEGREINKITTAVFDLKPITGDVGKTPPKSDPYYYFRPWKTILSRTVADGGESFYFCGEHSVTLPHLADCIFENV